MASKMLFGKTWVMKSFRFRARSSGWWPPGSGRARPGMARLQQVGEEQPERSGTQRGADEPAEGLGADAADGLESPMLARPDTRVAKTSGAMIILIRRRKMSVRMPK
jgi:hypothetical protein